MPRDPLPVDLQHFQQEVPFSLEQDRLLRNLRVSRRGCAAGPSGMTADHLRPLLESVQDSELLWRLCQGLARAEDPLEVLRVVKMGRITALQKPTGGVRGIVVGDILRRLVARTISQTSHSGSGSRNGTIPICSFNKGRDRMRVSRVAGND